MARCVTCGQVHYSKECPKCKGNAYEEYVAEHFRAQGYTVVEHGKLNGVADRSIDLILKKEREITLVQCKNYKLDTRHKINHEKIKAFVGETAFYLRDNPMYENYTLKLLYVVSNPVLEQSALRFINSHSEKIAYLHLPFNVASTTVQPQPEPSQIRKRPNTYANNTRRQAYADVVLSRNNKNKEAFVIMLLIFGVIGILSYLGSQYLSHVKQLEMAKQQQALENQRRLENERALARQQAQKRRPAYQSRYVSPGTHYVPKTKTYSNAQVNNAPINNNLYRAMSGKEPQTKKSYTTTQTVRPTTKQYVKLSDNIKLKSTSRITTLSDNRLASNAPIYGTYSERLSVSTPVCGKRDIRDIGLVNECYVETYGSDRLYFKKSWFNEFANYNHLKHKQIDCDYSKKHGILHNCKIWNG